MKFMSHGRTYSTIHSIHLIQQNESELNNLILEARLAPDYLF